MLQSCESERVCRRQIYTGSEGSPEVGAREIEKTWKTLHESGLERNDVGRAEDSSSVTGCYVRNLEPRLRRLPGAMSGLRQPVSWTCCPLRAAVFMWSASSPRGKAVCLPRRMEDEVFCSRWSLLECLTCCPCLVGFIDVCHPPRQAPLFRSQGGGLLRPVKSKTFAVP
jgi:hypothetical protein